MERFLYKRTSLIIKKGNILDEMADAIVCPANSLNTMRGGVAAVIRLNGGDIIEEEAKAFAPINIGKAVLTTGGNLKSKHVIHAPTMKLAVEKTNTANIRKAVNAALICADNNHLSNISFPGMGTGTGEVSYDDAAKAMISEIKRYLNQQQSDLSIISLVAYSDSFYASLVDVARIELK